MSISKETNKEMLKAEDEYLEMSKEMSSSNYNHHANVIATMILKENQKQTELLEKILNKK